MQFIGGCFCRKYNGSICFADGDRRFDEWRRRGANIWNSDCYQRREQFRDQSSPPGLAVSRRYANAYAERQPDGDPDRNPNATPNANPNSHSDRNTNSYSYRNANSYSYRNANSYSYCHSVANS